MYGVIYKAVNLINNKFYIGQTINLQQRIKTHIQKSRKPVTKFQCAIKSYGIVNFRFEIIDTALSKEELDLKEEKWIAELAPQYNMTCGPRDNYWKNHPRRKEIAKKLSSTILGKKKASWKDNLIEDYGIEEALKIIKARAEYIRYVKEQKFIREWAPIIYKTLRETGSVRGTAKKLGIARTRIKAYFKYTGDDFKLDKSKLPKREYAVTEWHKERLIEKTRKPVFQISVETKLIVNKFVSASEAQRQMGFPNERKIHAAASGKSYGRKAYNYHWFYQGDYKPWQSPIDTHNHLPKNGAENLKTT